MQCHLEEKLENCLEPIGTGKDLHNITLIPQALRTTISKMKLSSFGHSQQWNSSYTSAKGYIKNSNKGHPRKQITEFKNGVRVYRKYS